MELKIRDSKIASLVKNRNLLTVGLTVAVVLSLIQAIALAGLVGKTRIVLVPPEIKEPLWVEPHRVSHAYLQQMSDYFLSLILNITPGNAAAKRELLLQTVHASAYGAVKAQLLEDETEIKKRQISRFFVPVSYEVNDRERWVKATGDLTLVVGQQHISTERVQYRIQYQIEAGRLLIEAFNQETEHGKN